MDSPKLACMHCTSLKIGHCHLKVSLPLIRKVIKINRYSNNRSVSCHALRFSQFKYDATKDSVTVSVMTLRIASLR